MSKKNHFNPRNELSSDLSFELGGKRYEVKKITQSLLDTIRDDAKSTGEDERLSEFLDRQLALFTDAPVEEFAAVDDVRQKRAVLQWLQGQVENPLGR